MLLSANEKARAVMFFGEGGINRELLYSEFEALLDAFVPINEWANTTAKAAYIEINSEFHIVAAVFFLVTFDSTGNVEPSWNIPLADLARTAHKGPDLGAGPVHLACASHCPVTYYSDLLWDPDSSPHSVHFNLLKKAVQRNKLGVHFKDASREETSPRATEADADRQMRRKYEQDMRDQVAQLLQEQKLQAAKLASEKDNAVAALRGEFSGQIESLQQQLEQKTRELADVQKRAAELQETVTGQAQKIEGLREYYEHKLERLQGADDELPELIGGMSQAEFDARLESLTQELKEQLRIKQVEVQYRVGLEEQLQAQLDLARDQVQALTQESAEQVLAELSKKGVNFVTYQPGAGHITIPLGDIHLFRNNPTAFVADFCRVDEATYLAWLKHYQAPVCARSLENGETCAADIPRVGNPAQFVPGVSEFCEQHQLAASSAKSAATKRAK